MSRPEKPIDWKRVDQLLLAGCHGTEIAAHFDMHPTTFYGKVEEKYKMSFTAYSQEKKQQGDSLLREKQFEKALDKDNTMLVWLGKQRLNQKENPGEHSANISPELLQKYIAVMQQISELQSERKIESTSEPKA